jgi:hypothetical protein
MTDQPIEMQLIRLFNEGIWISDTKSVNSGEKKKNTVVWDATPCSPLKANLRFGGTYCLHLQVRGII